MNCCTRCYDDQFDDAQARSDLERFRKRGPNDTTRKLLDALRAQGVASASVIDIGGGIGAVHHDLIDAGATSAVHVDASASYIAAAQQEVARRGHTDQVSFVHGDFVALAPDLPSADVVTLDRVICCYRDMNALVSASASHAKRLYGAVYPRDRWFLRFGFRLVNAFNRLRRNAFRIYLHSPAAIDATVARAGLARQSYADTFIWRVAVYSR